MVANLKTPEHIMEQGYHGNRRPSVDDRHESNHEFNMFLDREIQKTLLGMSDKVADNDTRGTNIFLGTGSVRPKGKAKQSKTEEFCAWTEPWKVHVHADKKTEKSAGKLSRDKDSSSSLWKDFKPKQINYIFKHYGDVKRYIEQYRYEHTYNFGPLSREPIEITTCKIVPIMHDTPSPSHRAAISEGRTHHNPFRRLKQSPSHPNLSENGYDVVQGGGEVIKHARSEPNIEDIVQSCLSASPVTNNTCNNNGFSSEPVQQTSRQSSYPNGRHEQKSLDNSETNSLQSHLSHNTAASSRPGSSKSVKNHQRPTSPWVSPRGRLRTPTRPEKNTTTSSVSLDTVSKLSPLQVLQVKTKGASAIHSGALPLFQGKTMKVVSASAVTTQSNNTEAINIFQNVVLRTGKVHNSKVAPLLTSTSLQAPNVKTLDMLSQMNTAETNQGQQQHDSNHKSEPNSHSEENHWTGKKSGAVNVKDPTTVSEASHNLQQGTDKEHYQSLVCELSYLDISTADIRATKALEAAQKQHFDVTGLTMSFAQKYEIPELGFTNGNELVDASEVMTYDDYGSEDVLNGSQESEDGSKVKEVSSTQSNGNGHGKKQPQVQLEKVSKNRTSDLKKEEIHKINEIKTRMSKKKEVVYPLGKIGNTKEKSPATKMEKSAEFAVSSRDESRKDTSAERQKSRVTFKMNPEVIDVEEDDNDGKEVVLPVQHQNMAVERIREVSSPDVARPVTVFPQLTNRSEQMAAGKNRDPKSKGPVKKMRDHSSDKASIMRRYFMDIAEREGNEQLMSKLQRAPDHSFKPASAGDASEKVHAKFRHSMDDSRVSYSVEKPHSSPCGTYVYAAASSPQSRPTLQNYSRLSPSKLATRQKSFYNSKTNVAAESDKKFLKDLSKLSKLKEIYMKTREKSELTKSGKSKPQEPQQQSSTTLHKIQTGQAEMEGMWFDSSGRAYVSLATRYDPIRK